ncbi:protein kinase domain-containing protein [Kribbella sp. NBC_00709]|uniref:protein kinase domain-containing protein n=1 Tax=Kribbella sp. NBC_00709 TaxID=2975972 RepID=UPI003FA593BA
MDLADLTGYSLRRQLGSGSAGTTWQVRDRGSGRNAVLKRIPIHAVPDPRRLREDLSMLSRVRHPHLTRLIDVRETETETELLVISQYIVAGSLARLLARRGPLTRGELVTLLVPLAEAVDYLHRSRLTHGAITPNNVLLDADGRPVLADATIHPGPPIADLHALAKLSHHAGADPNVFTTDLFTKTPPHALPRRLLSLAAPIPIDLGSATPTIPPTTPAIPPTKPAIPSATPTTPPAPPSAGPTVAATPAATGPADPTAMPTVTPASPAVSPVSPVALPGSVAADPAGQTALPSVSSVKPAAGPTSLAVGSDGPPASPTVPPASPALGSADPAGLSAPGAHDSSTATAGRTGERAAMPAAKAGDSTAPVAGQVGSLGVAPVGGPDDPAVVRLAVSGETDLSALLSEPRPTSSDETPGDDDPIALSRGPLPSPPPKPPTAPPTPPDRPEQATPATGGSKRSRRRRTQTGRGHVLRRLPHLPSLPHPSHRGFLRLLRLSPFPWLSHSTYGALAAAGLGAVVVLAIGVATIRILDAPETARADPAYSQPTHGLPQPTLTGPQSAQPTSTRSQPTRTQSTGPQSTTVEQSTIPARPSSPGRPTTSTQPSSYARPTTPAQTKSLPEATRPVRPTGGPEPANSEGADAVMWTRTLRALDAQRAKAFWTLDLEALDRIYVPGSSPWRADRSLLSSYRQQQLRVEGLRVQIDSAAVAGRTPTTVTLKTIDYLAAGQAVDRTGTRTPFPPGTPMTRLITLSTSPSTPAWRISSITRA